MEDKYNYNRFGKKGVRVGQAVMDIISKDQPEYTVEDILDGMAEDFTKELTDTYEKNKKLYRNPFYVLVLTQKTMWAANVIRNFFIARQTPPHASDLERDYPNHTKTLYMFDSEKGQFKVIWSLPGIEEMKSVLRNPMPFHDDLVHWIYDFKDGKLDRDFYSFNAS
jgi:hypothetical protein